MAGPCKLQSALHLPVRVLREDTGGARMEAGHVNQQSAAPANI
jgi:hypothetical protein